MKKIFLLVVTVVLLAFAPVAHASGNTEARAWNAGAVVIETDTSRGQGYLVRDGDRIKVFTIHHVIADADEYVYISVPGVVDRSRVETLKFHCETRIGDNDTGCYATLSEDSSAALLEQDSPVLPYLRVSAHRLLQVGQLVGSPRPDTGKWTIYEISDINDDEIVISAVFYDLDGDGKGDPSAPAGNFCHGRSGGPVVLINLDRNGVQPILSHGSPISIGELQNAIGAEHPDYIDPSNTCSYTVGVNRAQ